MNIFPELIFLVQSLLHGLVFCGLSTSTSTLLILALPLSSASSCFDLIIFMITHQHRHRFYCHYSCWNVLRQLRSVQLPAMLASTGITTRTILKFLRLGGNATRHRRIDDCAITAVAVGSCGIASDIVLKTHWKESGSIVRWWWWCGRRTAINGLLLMEW